MTILPHKILCNLLNREDIFVQLWITINIEARPWGSIDEIVGTVRAPTKRNASEADLTINLNLTGWRGFDGSSNIWSTLCSLRNWVDNQPAEIIIVEMGWSSVSKVCHLWEAPHILFICQRIELEYWMEFMPALMSCSFAKLWAQKLTINWDWEWLLPKRVKLLCLNVNATIDFAVNAGAWLNGWDAPSKTNSTTNLNDEIGSLFGTGSCVKLAFWVLICDRCNNQLERGRRLVIQATPTRCSSGMAPNRRRTAPKLANAMHPVKLPRRHPEATVVAIVLGWVGTSILLFIRGGLLVISGLMRSGHIGILLVLAEILLAVEMVSNGLGAGGGGGVLNTASFTRDAFGQCGEAFLLPGGGMEVPCGYEQEYHGVDGQEVVGWVGEDIAGPRSLIIKRLF